MCSASLGIKTQNIEARHSVDHEQVAEDRENIPTQQLSWCKTSHFIVRFIYAALFNITGPSFESWFPTGITATQCRPRRCSTSWASLKELNNIDYAEMLRISAFLMNSGTKQMDSVNWKWHQTAIHAWCMRSEGMQPRLSVWRAR